jgi:hypothetical protein
MLCAFDQRLDDYIGAPRVAAFGLSALAAAAPQPDAVVKDFDMDSATLSNEQVHARFGAVFPNGATSCLLAVFFGRLENQYGGEQVPVTCKRIGTAILDFETVSLKEFLETGRLSDVHDPPVLSARLRDLAWHGEAVKWPFEKRDWVPEGLEMLVDDGAVTLSFCGEGIDDFASPEFSDFRV